MAKKKLTLGDQPEKKVTQEFLNDSPEGFPDAAQVNVVVAEHVPEYEDVVFVNQRDPGVMLEFHYKSKTHPMHHYKLMDGETYKLTKEVIDHLQSCSIPIYGKEIMERGVFSRPVISRKYFYSFRNPKTFRKSA